MKPEKMNADEIKKMEEKQRVLGAAVIVVFAMLSGAGLFSFSTDSVLGVWLTTAVYMLGILLGALIFWPVVGYDRRFFITAVILAISLVIPAFFNASMWANSWLPDLGSYANSIFFIYLLFCLSLKQHLTELSLITIVTYWVVTILTLN